MTAAKIGPFALVLWLLAMVCFFLPSAIVVARLTERDPGEGGIYRWVATAFGEEQGFLAGWSYWVNNLVYYPSLLVTTAAIGAYALGPSGVHFAQNPVYVAVFSLAVLWLALGLNIMGLSVGKWVQNAGGYGTWIPALVLVVLALGINARSADPTAVGVTVSPGNRECVVGLIGQSGKLVVSITPGVAEHRSLKLPPRSASEGTFCGAMVEGFFSRRHSSEKKKKVFFLSEL